MNRESDSPVDDSPVDDILESMAVLDRHEVAFEDVDEPTFDPPSAEWSEAVIRAAAASVTAEASGSEPSSNEAAANHAPTRWPLWAAAAAGVVLTVVAVALFRSSPDPEALGRLGPCEVQLGGTARVLGEGDDQPRQYGPGDRFVLRVVPQGEGIEDVPISVLAKGGGRMVPLELERSIAPDGAAQLTGPIAQRLDAGVWTLQVRVGWDCDAEPSTPPTCITLGSQTEVDVVAR